MISDVWGMQCIHLTNQTPQSLCFILYLSFARALKHLFLLFFPSRSHLSFPLFLSTSVCFLIPSLSCSINSWVKSDPFSLLSQHHPISPFSPFSLFSLPTAGPLQNGRHWFLQICMADSHFHLFLFCLNFSCKCVLLTW